MAKEQSGQKPALIKTILIVILVILIIIAIGLAIYYLLGREEQPEIAANDNANQNQIQETDMDVVPDQPGLFYISPRATKLTGDGNQETDPMELKKGVYVVQTIHQSAGNIMVDVYDQDDSWLGIMVNETGGYNGYTVLTIDSTGEYYFDIVADGPWSIALEQTVKSDTTRLMTSISGVGDSVSEYFLLTNGAKTFKLNSGQQSSEKNFIVYLLDEDGQEVEILVNELTPGQYQSRINISEGVYMLRVEATGEWDIQITD
jgi:hypothetical protein